MHPASRARQIDGSASGHSDQNARARVLGGLRAIVAQVSGRGHPIGRRLATESVDPALRWETPDMPSVPEAAIDILIGLCAGAGGAFFGARAQWRIHYLEQKEQRTKALWVYQRALQLTSQWLARDVEYERVTKPVPSLEDAEVAAVPYFHTLPPELQNILNRDHYVTPHDTSFEASENMWEKAMTLKTHLQQEK